MGRVPTKATLGVFVLEKENKVIIADRRQILPSHLVKHFCVFFVWNKNGQHMMLHQQAS